MNIRDLKIEDASALNNLYAQLTSRLFNVDIEGLIQDSTCYCRILEKDGSIVGTGTLVTYHVPTKGLVGRIEDMVIDESQRGKGLGRAMMEDLLKIAQEKGLKFLTLTSNPKRIPARRLYESMGFEIFDTGVFWKKM